jgi:endonuclease/exonuclease/phosphatase family metal-dependent hydrolase
MPYRTLGGAALAAALMLGVTVPSLGPQVVPDPSCRAAEPHADRAPSLRALAPDDMHLADSDPTLSVRWDRPDAPEARVELDRWCRAVGPPTVHRPQSGATGHRTDALPSASLDGLVLVAWNTHVGGGDLDRLLEDLRTGTLTGGGPPPHFVLLLQEVYRTGEPVPERARGEIRSAERVDHRALDREHGAVDEVARRHGLHLFYAPSMRNGHVEELGDGLAEDRGNAILSTLPLSDLQILELPVQKQRRIAAAATIRGRASDGRAWDLRVVSVHLDHISGWRRFHRSFGADRARHAGLLVEAFGNEERVALGGDFNSWFGGPHERGIRLMRTHFPHPGSPPNADTLLQAIFPLSRQVDHLFFRLPEAWAAEYQVVSESYGSDHLPLVGWIRLDDVPAASSPGSGGP